MRKEEKIGQSECNLPDFLTFKKKLLQELERVKSHNLGVMIYGMERTSDEIVDPIDTKSMIASNYECTLPAGLYEISDLDLILESLILIEVKVITF